MCRITAVISDRPVSARDLLCEGPKSLLAQAGAVPGRYQDDGWGIARPGAAGRLSLIKSPRPARREKAAFARAAAAPARVTLAHLREASNPGNLPRARLLGPRNTQPFSAGGLAFAHNGTLFIKDEVRSLLGKYAARIKGENDSEVLFWQVMKMMDAYGAMDTALEMALDEIRTIWISCKDSYPGVPAPYRGLNLFLAAKDSLAVLCHSPLGKKTALLTPAWPFGRVAWRLEKNRAVFSSEPADAGPGWKKMNDPEIAVARARGGKIELSFRRLSL
jgi:predicted glutamine amidotransferase